MLDFLFRFALVGVLIIMTYALFGALNVTPDFQYPEEPLQKQLHTLYPEILFVGLSWLCFVFLINLRLTLLIGFIAGQSSLYFLTETVVFNEKTFPIFVLIGANCLFLLLLYFYFASERWGSGSLEGEYEEYTRDQT